MIKLLEKHSFGGERTFYRHEEEVMAYIYKSFMTYILQSVVLIGY